VLGEGPSKCLAVEKQSIKIVANKIGNKQKCALSKTTNELIDTKVLDSYSRCTHN
jgi:hypothetical protein